ncbi:MAG: glutaredoxin family protein [Actinobacteria bacterium]|jgi:glutaredoxin|nr:glutaredoxin family protein [Actinomycetota bacterium]
MTAKVTIYSRHGCHLCDVMKDEVVLIQQELSFTIEIIYIDKNIELEEKYGEQVPVILINGENHDFFKLNETRFRKALVS